MNVAALYQRLGLHERALEEYRGLAFSTLAPAEQAQRLSNLGALYRHLGDPYKALECYRQARDLYARDRNRDGELGALKNTGIAEALDLHQYKQALDIFDEILALAEKTGNRREAMQARLYRAETLLRMGRNGDADFSGALAAARELKTPEEEWKALFALGRVEEAARVIEGLRQQAPGGEWRGRFLAEKRDVYDAVIGQRLDRNDAEGFLEWSEKARARMLKDQLGKTLPHGTSLAALQHRLGPGAILLVYWQGPNRGAVLWATRERHGLLPRETVDVQKLLEALSSPSGANWREQALAVSTQLLGGIPPLEARSVRQVIVAPDGLLQVVPFEALPMPGRNSLLVEEAPVTYVPTASMLARDSQQKAGWWNPPWRRSLLAMAASHATDPLNADASLPRLANADQEVRAIAQIVPGRTLALTSGAAGKRALEAAMEVPLVHVAAHAAISEERPERSRILMGRDSVFLGEAAQLGLDGVDLVTLSACETERGRLVQGEGVASFSRAFLAAGARAVVTTLWRVEDRPTAAFMERFYYHLARGQTKEEALAQAKREFLRAGGPLAHPYYWAAFVLNGEGWQPAPLPVSWPAALVVSGLAAVVLCFGWRRRITARRG